MMRHAHLVRSWHPPDPAPRQPLTSCSAALRQGVPLHCASPLAGGAQTAACSPECPRPHCCWPPPGPSADLHSLQQLPPEGFRPPYPPPKMARRMRPRRHSRTRVVCSALRNGLLQASLLRQPSPASQHAATTIFCKPACCNNHLMKASLLRQSPFVPVFLCGASSVHDVHVHACRAACHAPHQPSQPPLHRHSGPAACVLRRGHLNQTLSIRLLTWSAQPQSASDVRPTCLRHKATCPLTWPAPAQWAPAATQPPSG
mmetsp:Transcript_41777/g.124960  ORF Transcript_41777/g.124960 Transcript_41777/m.124960 type:complete len:258 (-) Transcript_41777:1290-2063(-)